MNVFIVGVSGCIGNAVAKEFLRQGHSVMGLSNTNSNIKKIQDQGINVVVGDMGAPAEWLHYLINVDVIVHAAHVRPGMRLSAKWLKKSKELRDICLNALISSAQINPKFKALIYTSGMIAHGNHGEKHIDESTAPNTTALGDYHLSGEKLISAAADKGLPALSIRPGMVYGNGGTFKKFFLDVAAKGSYQFPGNGENYIPFIHINDLAKAYVAAATTMPQLKIINIVDDQPIRMKDMAASLLSSFGGGKHSSVPAWLVSIFAGKALSEMLVGSYRVKNNTAKKSLQWEPEYPYFTDGIKQVVAEYRK